MSENNNIRVAIRVRPLIAREKQSKSPILWDVKNDSIGQVSGTDTFCYDRVFGYEDDNKEVYNDLCFPIVRSVVDGFNGTIFTYGQPSSGKTYTMMGEHSGILKGIIHYTINDIFNLIQEMPERDFLLRVSFLEIYNGKVYDLLSNKYEDLKLQEDGYGFVKVNGLQERIVQTPDQTLESMSIGQKKRRTGETQMNRASSRSHSIFRMILESRVRDNEDAGVNVSELSLVDLAGSENVKQTKTEGDRFKEGIHINLSLSTLRQVISQLNEKEDQFINFRNSKLTRLLQNSLGGNALTAILCTVTPTSLIETLSTLNFASRAEKIKNKPEKNEILTDQALLKQYANKIKLNQELEILKRKISSLNEQINNSLYFQSSVPSDISENAGRNKIPLLEITNSNLKQEKSSQQVNSSVQSQLNRATYLTNSSFNDSEYTSNEKNKENTVETETSFEHIDTLIKSQLNKAVCLENNSYSFNTKTLTDKSAEGSVFDETRKSHFLAFYDEDESECVSKLKKEVEALTHDTEIKDKELILLKDTLKAKEQEISSLKSKINIEFDVKNDKMETCAQTSMINFDTKCTDNKDEEISMLKVEVKAKEQEICSLKEQITIASDFKNSEINAIQTSMMNVNVKKDEEISVLKNEVKIKEKEIFFLKDPINAVKDFENQAETSSQTSMIDFELKTPLTDLCSKNIQTSPLNDADHKNLRKANKEIEALQYDNELKEQRINILKDKMEIKEQLITSLTNEINLSKNSIRSMNEKCDNGSQTTVMNYNLGNEDHVCKNCHEQRLFDNCINFDNKITKTQSCQTSFELLVSKEMSNIACQTSPTTCNCEGKETTFFKDTESVEDLGEIKNNSRLSPLGIYLESTGTFENYSEISDEQNPMDSVTTPIVKSQIGNDKKNFKDVTTTPKKCKESRNMERKFGRTTDDKLLQTSPVVNMQICNCNVIKTNTSHIPAQSRQDLFCSPSSNKNATNQSNEMKSLINKVNELKTVMLELVESFVESEYMEGDETSASFGQECLLNHTDQDIETLSVLIRKLEFYIKRQKDCSNIIKEQLEEKFKEVLSLDLKLSEAESSLSKKEKLISNMTENVFKLRDSISRLALISSRYKDVRSMEEFQNIKQSNNSSCLKSGSSNVLHDLKIMQDIVIQMNSDMEENALSIVSSSEKLNAAKRELTLIKKEKSKSSEIASKAIQVDYLSDASNADKSNDSEKTELTYHFENEIKSLKEKNYYLEKNNEKLKSCLKEQEENLTWNYEQAKSDWEKKTRILVQDIEAKYERELSDQECKLTEKLIELKQDSVKEKYKREHEYRESFLKMKSLHEEELINVRDKLKNEISELSDKFNKERIDLRFQIEKENEDKVLALKKKLIEMRSFNSRKIAKYEDLVFTYEMEKKRYIEQINNLESNMKELEERGSNSKNFGSYSSNENETKLAQERDLLLSKYERAKEHINKLNEELTKLKLESGSKRNVVKTNKEFEEVKHNFLNEIDQKKAKIMSLEANNSSLVKEMKKLKEQLSLKFDACKCKVNIKNSNSDVLDSCRSHEKSHKSKFDQKPIEINQAQKFTESDSEQQNSASDSKGKDADERELCIGGGSGPANMVKCFWLEGVIQKKDKKLAESQKKISELETELKSLKRCPVRGFERKEIPKEPEAKVRDPPLDEADENVTVYNKALHPYQLGAIPKVKSKQILKEKNLRTSANPYENLLKTDTLRKLDADCDKMRSSSTNTKSNKLSVATPLTELDAAKMVTGQTECKQQ